MVKFKSFLRLLCFLTLLGLHVSLADHPHGEAKYLMEVERDGDEVKFKGNEEVINSIFLHPNVKDRKIVVFSIIGAYRQGKSFFLGYCMRYLYATYPSISTIKNGTFNPTTEWLGNRDQPLVGFSWKHGATADTKGMVIWSDVFLHDTEDEKIAIILIDTQGLYEIDSTEEENAKIFSLATLISSIEAVNIKERIEESQIKHLDTAISLTKFITERSGNSTFKPFQNLLFLIRDFSDVNYEFGYEGGEKYLETFLGKRSKANSVAGLIRSSIRGSFDEITCFLLNYPGEGIKKAKGEWGKLNEDFVKNLKSLVESLFAPKNLIKKSVLGQEISALEYKNLLSAYFETYQNFETPESASIFDVSVNSQMQSIVDEKFSAYMAKMSEEVNFEDKIDDFITWWNEKENITKSSALQGFFEAKKFNDPIKEKAYGKILENKIDDSFKILNDLQMKAYKNFLELRKQRIEAELSGLVEKQLNAYATLMIEDITYDEEDFIDWWNQKHEDTKVKIINGFISASNFGDLESQNNHRNNLETKIAEKFKALNEIQIAAYTNHLTQITNRMSEISRSLLNSISSEMDQNFDGISDDSSLNSKFQELKRNKISQFYSQTNNFNHPRKQKEIENSLEFDLNSAFEDWKVNIKNVKEALKKTEDESFDKYKREFGNPDDMTRDDYTYYIDDENRKCKENAKLFFLIHTSTISNKIFKENFEKNLVKRIDLSYSSFKDKNVEKYKKLRNEGIWVEVDITKGEIPKYAVKGGDNSGRNTYIACAAFEHRGKFRGVIVGKYTPSWNIVNFPFNNKAYEFNTGKRWILTHTNWEFVDKDSTKEKIRGGEDNEGVPIFVCRSKKQKNRFKNNIVNGKLHNDKCYIPWGPDEHRIGDYEILVKIK